MNRALLGLPLLCACGPIKSTPVTMTGHLLDNPSEDASPVGGATITVRDGNAEIFGEATSSDDGSFAVDVPAGAFFTVTSSADGYVPTSISGQAASGDFDAGDGNVWTMADQVYEGVFATFSGCANVDEAGGLIYGQVRLWSGTSDDAEIYTVTTATAQGYDNSGAEVSACYLDDDGTSSGLATETGDTGYFAMFGVAEGASTVVINYTLSGNSAEPYYWPVWVPEDGVAPLLPAYVEVF